MKNITNFLSKDNIEEIANEIKITFSDCTVELMEKRILRIRLYFKYDFVFYKQKVVFLRNEFF